MIAYINDIINFVLKHVDQGLVTKICYTSPIILSALVSDSTKTIDMPDTWMQHPDIVKIALAGCITIITWFIVDYIKDQKGGIDKISQKIDILSEKLHQLIGEHNANHGGK